MKKFIVLLILAMVSWLQAADKTVIGGGGGDYTTIDAAIQGASDGDVILISDDTGGGCTNGVWAEAPNISAGNTESLTIKPDPANTYPIIIKPTSESATAYSFTLPEEDIAGTYTFEDITFDNTNTTAAAVVFKSSSSKHLIFNRCTFVPNSVVTYVFLNTYNDTGKSLEFHECVCNAVHTANLQFINATYGDTIDVNNCNVDWTLGTQSNTTNGKIINVSRFNLCKVRNTTIKHFTYGLYLQHNSYLDITDNTITKLVTATTGGDPIFAGVFTNWSHSGTATGGGNDYILIACNATLLDDYWNNAYITILSGTGLGQKARIIDYDKTENVNGEKYAQIDAVWAVNPDNTSVYLIEFADTTQQAFITNNTITCTPDTTANYGIMCGESIAYAEITGNKIVNLENEHCLTIRSTTALVENNIIYGSNPIYWQGKENCVVRSNTLYSTNFGCLQWRIPGNSTDNTPLGTLSASKNIFFATGSGSYCIYDSEPNNQNQPKLNNNCYYYTNSANAGNLNNMVYATLDDIKAKWATPGVWGANTLVWLDNDTNSIVADPQFVNGAGGDFRPKNANLKLTDGTWIGADAPPKSGGWLKTF